MGFKRTSPVSWQFSMGRWLIFATQRPMVRVDKVRNRFKGIRSWSLRIGKVHIEWR